MQLFTLGPVEMFPFTKEIDKQKIPYFRTEEFSELMLESERLLKKHLDTDSSSKTIFLTASGTAAMEATVFNCFTSQDRLLIIDGGIFGHRFVQICDSYKIPYDSVKLAYGEVLTEESLRPYEDTKYSGMLVNIDETSTCQLYDIKLLADFCHKKGMYLIVDAISSFLADEYHMDQYGIDATILSSQKGLALAPGMSFVVLSERLYKQRVCEIQPVSLYFDFKTYVENQRRGQPPYTSAVRVALELNDMLRHLEAEGIKNRIKKVENIVKDFRSRVPDTGLRLPEFPLSNAATPLIFPEHNANEVYLRLKNYYGIILTPCGGDLKDLTVRVGHIGCHSVEENEPLIVAIKSAIADVGLRK